MTKHLTEEEIQDVAMRSSACDPQTARHATNCPECMARVNEYRLLFEAMRELRQPAFDFDIGQAVLQHLPQKKRRLKENRLIYAVLSPTVLLLAGLGYFFRNSVATLFSGIGILAVLLIVTTITTFLTVLCLDMYQSFQKKMHTVDLY